MTPAETQARALRWRGYSIFPLFPGTKSPHWHLLPTFAELSGRAKPSWKPFQSQRASFADVDLWFSVEPCANYGIATGRLSRFFAVDCDTLEAINWFEPQIERFGPVVQTSSSHKRQYYFAHPGFETQNGVSKIFPGLDVRGDGGFVVGPGSVHPNGATYKWLLSPDEAPLQPAPQWLLDAVRKKEFVPAPQTIPIATVQGNKRYQRYAAVAFQNALEAIASAPDGMKHAELFKRVACVAGFVSHGLVDEGELRAKAYQAVEPRSKDKRGAFQTIEDAIRRGRQSPARLPI